MHLPFLRCPQSKASQRQHQFENSRIQILQSEAKRAIVALHANGHRVRLREPQRVKLKPQSTRLLLNFDACIEFTTKQQSRAVKSRSGSKDWDLGGAWRATRGAVLNRNWSHKAAQRSINMGSAIITIGREQLAGSGDRLRQPGRSSPPRLDPHQLLASARQVRKQMWSPKEYDSQDTGRPWTHQQLSTQSYAHGWFAPLT